MARFIAWCGALAVAAFGVVGCGDDDIPGLSSDGGTGGGSGSGGAAGSGGSAAGAGGSAPGTGTGASAAGFGSVGASGGSSAGRGGSDGAPDAGALDAGFASSDAGDAGACTDPACVCAVDVITAVPYSQQWQTTEDTEADVVDIEGCQVCDNTADHIVTFTAPATASYRFFATSGGDVELAVYPGDCRAQPTDVSCGEDIDAQNEDYSDVVDVEIAQGETVTVVVGEECEENGGTGTLAIDVAP